MSAQKATHQIVLEYSKEVQSAYRVGEDFLMAGDTAEVSPG